MSLEALTETQIRHECTKRGLDPKKQKDQLLVALGAKPRQVTRMQPWEQANALNRVIRKDIILQGDEDCYKKAKKASDGFEHGFLDFKDVHDYSLQARAKIAGYLRRNVLGLLELQAETSKALLSEPFAEPMGHWPIARYFRGTLVGESDELASPDSAYPFMRWSPRLSSCSIGDDGQIHIGLDDRWTAELADGIELKDANTEVWRPN